MERGSADELVAAILNDWWMVRHYARGGRFRQESPLAAQRRQAILRLGLTVRRAFNASDDFEALLAAVVDGARHQSSEPPF